MESEYRSRTSLIADKDLNWLELRELRTIPGCDGGPSVLNSTVLVLGTLSLRRIEIVPTITDSGFRHCSGNNGLWTLPFEPRSDLRVLPSQCYGTPVGVPACANSGYKTLCSLSVQYPTLTPVLSDRVLVCLRQCKSA